MSLSITMMTLNLHEGDQGSNSPNCWEKRRDICISVITSYSPTILCTQQGKACIFLWLIDLRHFRFSCQVSADGFFFLLFIENRAVQVLSCSWISCSSVCPVNFSLIRDSLTLGDQKYVGRFSIKRRHLNLNFSIYMHGYIYIYIYICIYIYMYLIFNGTKFYHLMQDRKSRSHGDQCLA